MVPRVALVLLVAALGGSALRSDASADAAAKALIATPTRSYYVANADRNAASKLGCFNSDVGGRLTLFFGAPAPVGAGFGATLWGAADQSTAQIGELAKDFIRGYLYCRKNTANQVLVGIGTSNSTVDRQADPWVTAHGNAWGTMVRDVAAWTASYYPGAAQVYGAWDAEPSWSSNGKAELWMQGYNGVPGRRPVYANFSADGCPRDAATGGACNNGWTQYHVWRLAWQYDPSLPIPQIYAPSGVNARQWQKIDEYGARVHHDGMAFSGAMAQFGACQQMGGCVNTNNTPQAARDILHFTLNSNPLTQQPTLETATDMYWHR